MIQALIFIFGATAIYLVGSKKSWSRWGYVLGLMGQPFWIYHTFVTGQWGIFLLSAFYAYSWANGIFNHFPIKEFFVAKLKSLK